MSGIPEDRLPLQIRTPVLVPWALILFWTRLGSLHALERVKKATFWKHGLGCERRSGDSLGRVYAGLRAEG